MQRRLFSSHVHNFGFLAATIVALHLPATAMAQSVTEFPIPTANSQPSGITTGLDGNLWFTESGNPKATPPIPAKIGRITPSGTIVEFTVPTATGILLSITSGPDGNLWFTDGGQPAATPPVPGKIGRITLGGIPTEFSPPLSNTSPTGITVGPENALWFTDGLASAIGRITTAGVISEFPVITTASVPLGITTGPDGNLWFLEFGNQFVTPPIPGKVGRITTAGNITEFPIATSNSQPISITSGPDGNLWFVENVGNKIGRITTAGAITEFSVPTANSGPGGITAGPDGNLWFTEANVGKIGRITTRGSILEIAIPRTPSSPQFIVTGSDGKLWFPDASANGIGTIAPLSTTGTVGLVSAILPASRSVQVNGTATVFATMINVGPGTASGCSVQPATNIAASFLFQTTDPTTNALIGMPNGHINLSQGQAQSFVVAFTPTAQFNPTDVAFNFTCANAAAPAPSFSGLNTLLLSGSSSPVPDVVTLAASVDPGIVDIPGNNGTGAFAVATVNLGLASAITVTADTHGVSLPISLSLCQTNPATGVCTSATGTSVSTTIAANATPTFAIFVQGNGPVAFSPAVNRVFVKFADGNGVIRGETSVAVRTQ